MKKCLKGKRALISTTETRVTFFPRLSRITRTLSRVPSAFNTSPESKLTRSFLLATRNQSPCSFTRRITNDEVVASKRGARSGLVLHEVGLNRGLKKRHDRSYPAKTSLRCVIDDVRELSVVVFHPRKGKVRDPVNLLFPMVVFFFAMSSPYVHTEAFLRGGKG